MRSCLLALLLGLVGCDDGERERQNHQITQLLGENETLKGKLQRTAEREQACEASLGKVRGEAAQLQVDLERLQSLTKVGEIGDTGVVDPEQAHGQPPP